jgi:hypothetical protein
VSFAVPRVAREVGLPSLAVLGLVVLISLFASRETRAMASVATPRPLVSIGATSDARVREKEMTSPTTIGEGVLAYPPRAGVTGVTTPETVVYLHGIHGRAENGCPYFRDGARALGWLVCPEANAVEAPGFTWAGSPRDVRAIVARAEQATGAADASPGVLVGFSQGAYVALDLVHVRLGSYRGLVLLGAAVAPSAADLRAAGVTRVVLGAGTRDGSYAPLLATAARLRREGVDVRFVSLGAVGHTYAAEDPATLTRAILFAGGRSDDA